MATYLDVARFRADDPAALVSAALACPLCLRSEDVQWRECVEYYEEAVDCSCPRCEQSWRVYLQPQQLLRLEMFRLAGG